MAAGALSIKLRCASWQQLATIYKRDLSRGAMFLKASTPPAIGTDVRIDLTLPSDTVIALSGVVDKHVTDPQRGSGVELRLAPIPESSVWLIESALSAETKVRAQTSSGVPGPIANAPASGPVRAAAQAAQASAPIGTIGEGDDVANAERELITALTSEVDSLKKLNPFLVLGVGYEATDADVRAAFGELTKRYHPDRFARYQSLDLRQIAAEIFILIRDAYRKVGDETSRLQVLQQMGRSPAPRAVPNPARPAPPPLPRPVPKRAATDPVVAPDAPSKPAERPSVQIPVVQVPAHQVQHSALPPHPQTPPHGTPRMPTGPLPTVPMPIGAAPRVSNATPPNPAPRDAHAPTAPAPTRPVPVIQTERRPVNSSPPPVLTDGVDGAQLDEMLDAGRVDDALAAFKVLAKKHPTDRSFRAGIELCEGIRALAVRDRLEAAQRFEAALEIDPSNERAARELAEMRRQATNERKGLLSRLMGKKE